MNGLALCSGYGGLELGLERVFDEYRTVCHVEGEAFAVSHLIKKMEEGRMDHSPIWSNVRTFDGKPWCGKVDIISGGFPCQPYSSAGKQMGKDDERDLWLDFVRIIREVRPGFLFFENVPGIIKWRLTEILLDIAKLGYHASWCVVGANETGAPHRRKRWFLFAVNTDSNITGQYSDERSILKERRNDVRGICSNVSDSCKERRDQREPNLWGGKFDLEGCGNVSDSNNGRKQIQTSRKFPSIKMPCRISEKRRIDKWQGMFRSWWEVEPSMGRLVNGASDWVDKLRLLGNGVVPQQAAYALQILGSRLACGVVENRTPKD